jgi:DNA-binding NtrC family response regulator
MRILIVDDEECLREVFANTLEAKGHDVTTAVNGRDGVYKFRTAEPPFDAVLSDWNMPQMNGYAMVVEILKMAPATKVVMMSGEPSNKPPEGVTLLEKPFKRDDLFKALGI